MLDYVCHIDMAEGHFPNFWSEACQVIRRVAGESEEHRPHFAA
jgi:hypothetical protein